MSNGGGVRLLDGDVPVVEAAEQRGEQLPRVRSQVLRTLVRQRDDKVRHARLNENVTVLLTLQLLSILGGGTKTKSDGIKQSCN